MATLFCRKSWTTPRTTSTTTDDRPKKYEIWVAKVYFDDHPDRGKNRPVLILEDNLAFVLSFKITTHAPRNDFPGEYSIVNWRGCGLLKPSTVRTSILLEISHDDFRYKLGDLQEPDVSNMEELLRNLYGASGIRFRFA